MPASPTWSSAASVRLAIAALREPELLAQREGHVLPAAHRVEQRAALEDHPVALAHLVQPAAAQARDVDPADLDAPAVGTQQPQQVLEEDRLSRRRCGR